MGYETSESARKSQVTAEMFVSEGLDDAINLDRESFNYAHPRYSVSYGVASFCISTDQQPTQGTRQAVADDTPAKEAARTREKLDEIVETALKSRGIEDVPDVLLTGAVSKGSSKLWRDGKTVLHRGSGDSSFKADPAN